MSKLQEIIDLKEKIQNNLIVGDEAFDAFLNISEKLTNKEDLEILVFLDEITKKTEQFKISYEKRKNINDNLEEIILLSNKKIKEKENEVFSTILKLNALPQFL